MLLLCQLSYCKLYVKYAVYMNQFWVHLIYLAFKYEKSRITFSTFISKVLPFCIK